MVIRPFGRDFIHTIACDTLQHGAKKFTVISGSTVRCSTICARGLHSRMPFPGNRIFPPKIWEIPGPEHLGTSYSRSRLSTGIRDWLFPGLVKGRETFRNSRTFPESKVKNLISVLVENFLTGTDLLTTILQR